MYNTGGLRKPPQPQTPLNESHAKEKLMYYVYEYLIHNNAPKTAEMFKNEVNVNPNIPMTDSPGFLTNWFYLFWDIYSAEPDRRDKYGPTQEAKAFHDFGFVPPSSGIPGMRPGFMPNMGMGPPVDGMSPYFRPGMQPSAYGPQRPPPPGSYGPPPMPGMFPPGGDMRNMGNPRMPRVPGFGGMRPMRYGGPSYMESPASNAPPGYYGMPPDQLGPSTSMNGMPPPDVGAGPPPPGGVLPPISVGGVNPLMNTMLNGEEIKQSPSHHLVHGGGGGGGNGTPIPPGSHPPPGGMMGPGSAPNAAAPASVQSQPGSNAMPPQPQQSTGGLNAPSGMVDHAAMMDFQNEIANAHQTPSSHEDLSEIKKIREGLLEDFAQ